jgi:hypothetical protein
VGLPGIESVVQFPVTFYHGIGAEYKFNEVNALGVQVYYNTTAGRNHLADYSGEYKMDMLLSSYATGIDYTHTFMNVGNCTMSASLGAGVRFSSFKTKESLTVHGDVLSHSDNIANGINIYTLPAIEVSYPLLRRVELKLKGGYEIDFRSKYKFTGTDEPQILYNRDGEFLNIDYSGLRMGLGIVYNF